EPPKTQPRLARATTLLLRDAIWRALYMGCDGGHDQEHAAEAVRAMIRIIIENILLFLLPTVIYVIYVAVTRDDEHKGIFDKAPLGWLMVAGSALVLIVLATYGSD